MNVIKIVGRIDNGGFGNVDKVICEDGKEYAMKTFSMNIPHTDELKKNALSRFKREVIFQSALKHRNIVPILFYDLEVESPYYIMPLAIDSVKKIKFTEKEEKVRMLLDVMAGLEEMHSRGQFHRDLKPGNILKFADEFGEYYAVGDFGLLSIDQTNITELTPVTMVKGSDYYTAPEIVESMARASIQSDIFSLGCLIHEVFGKGNRIPCQPIAEEGILGKLLSICTHKKPFRRYKAVSYLREAFISVSNTHLEMSSPEGKKLLNLLEEDRLLTFEEWENIIEFLCNEKNDKEDIDALFNKINISKINELISLDMNLADSYGVLFSDWVRENHFIFDFCDVIGRRLDTLIRHCNFNTQSQCIVAMLYMGTSHNRFFVEELCYKWLCNVTSPPEMAERLSMEIESEGKYICKAISHLEYSIRISRKNFNPLILETVNKICN